MTRSFNIKAWLLRLIFIFIALTTATTANTCCNHLNVDKLISRQEFFGDTAEKKQMLRISPDGKQLSYIAPFNGILNIWVAPSDDLSKAKPVTKDKGRGIREYTWTYTNNDIIYNQDSDGDEKWRIYVLNLKTQKAKLITPAKSAKAQLQKLSPKFPQEIVVGLNDRDSRNHDLYRINIHTGNKKLIYKNEGFEEIFCDEDLNMAFAVKTLKDGSAELLSYSNNEFSPYKKISYEDYLTYDFLVGINSEHLYMLDSQNSNFKRLFQIKLADIKSKGAKAPAKVIFKDSKADVSEVLRSKTTGEVLAASSTYFKQKWQLIDPKVSKTFKNLSSKLDGNISIVSQSLDDQHWIVAAGSDTQPLSYYYYNLEKDELKLVFCISPELAKHEAKFSKMHPVKIRARDGLILPSYITLPKDVDKDGASTKPIPFVVLVHGGPQSRDDWGFNNQVQWLANRGYGVLQMNYRISTGLGKELIRKGEYGGPAIEDLVDGAKWLLKNKFSTKDKIAIMGGSYGGYATLAALTFHPDVFACGIDIVGRSNLTDYIQNIPDYWQNFLPSLLKMLGADPRTEEGKKYLRSKSPLFFADQIKVPLLILHGKNDPRIKQKESDLIVAEMNKKAVPVAYGVFQNEGHGFVRAENRIASRALIEIFLAKYLGGKHQPIGDDAKKSSLIMKQDPIMN